MRIRFVFLAAAMWCGLVCAQVPQTIGYQGKLTDNAASPISGAVNMQFQIYDAATNGNALWTEPVAGGVSVVVTGGLFDVLLGSNGVPLPYSVFAGGSNRWLQIYVNGEVLLPRQKFAAVSYAHQAQNSTTVTNGVTTTGSYADPAWITALNGTKITGTIGTGQIANNAVTQAKLLVPSGIAANGKVLGTDGTSLVWQTDTNSGGTVTSVTAGIGLSGGPITGAGTLSIANLGVGTAQLADASVTAAKLASSGCTNGQILKYTGGAWTCAPSGGTVTSIAAGAGLTGGTITTSGSIALDPTSSTLTGNYFKQGGNSFGVLPNQTAVVGTNDANALQLIVNGMQALRLEGNATSSNHIAGYAGNSVTAGTLGATIGGGGQTGSTCSTYGSASCGNSVTDNFGTVGGGVGNVAGDGAGTAADSRTATVGGGDTNTASGRSSTVGGGDTNTASGRQSTVGGGYRNNASQTFATVGGGQINNANAAISTVGGGSANVADNQGSTVSGGSFNSANGFHSTVPGGLSNTASGDYSFAAGKNAKAYHHHSFVWGSDPTYDTNSTSDRSFTVNAPGGINLSGDVNSLGFGATPRQMINLYQGTYGIGVQDNTTYFRSGQNFAWYATGVHSNTQRDAGGGLERMWLDPGGLTVDGTFVSVSDRNKKENFERIDAMDVLDRVATLPLHSWNYRSDDRKVRHLGPMAQDFYAAFAIGPDDKHIATVDESGVALAAIQGLNAKVEEQAAAVQRRMDEKDAKIEAQVARIDALEKQAVEIAMLKQQMAELQAAALAGSKLAAAK